MSYRTFVTYTCDGCGKKESLEGNRMPDKWTGNKPAESPYDWAVNWIGFPQTHYCDECNTAVLAARVAALEARAGVSQ